MPEKKKYWWLRLREHFFTQLPIKRLRRLPGGSDYVIIYLKLQLLSLKNDGWLYYVGLSDDISEELAEELDEQLEAVRFVLNYCEKLGWLSISESNDVHFEQLDCGSETAAAGKMRELREQRRAKSQAVLDSLRGVEDPQARAALEAATARHMSE